MFSLMPKVKLSVGEAIVVEFDGCDEQVTVGLSDRRVPVLVGCSDPVARRMQDLGGIVVHVNQPDIAGRGGVLYHRPDVPRAGT